MFCKALSAQATIDISEHNYGNSIRCIKDDDIDPGYVEDFDGNIYQTIKIGNQVWMKSNLRVTHFNDGTPIPIITDPADWIATNDPACCWYDNIPEP
jgi:hypothetical protein